MGKLQELIWRGGSFNLEREKRLASNNEEKIEWESERGGSRAARKTEQRNNGHGELTEEGKGKHRRL